jgi:hypothetical protein
LTLHSGSAGTTILNPSDFPSGDQRTSLGAWLVRVTCIVAPSASMYRTKICGGLPGSGSARYAIRVPSGDHTGSEPLTRNRCAAPSAAITQSADSHASFVRSTVRRTKTTRFPSGETLGEATVS